MIYFPVVSDVNLLLLTPCKKLDSVFQVCLLRNFFPLNIHIVYTRFFYETFEIYQYFIPQSESLVITFLFCSIKAKRQVSNMTSNLIPYHRGTYFKIGFNGLLVTSVHIN